MFLTNRLLNVVQLVCFFQLTFAIGMTRAAEPSWPRFRGPNGSGVSEGSVLPVDFGPERNVKWKTELELGHSSPVISGDRIFLTGFTTEKLFTICVDRNTGDVVWKQEAPLRNGTVPRVRKTNSPASSSPAVDREAVYVYFDAFGILAYDLAGNERWRKKLPKAKQPWGTGASPVVEGDLVILNVDQDIDSYLLALNRKTGEEVWRTERVEFRRGWSTPLVVDNQVIVAGSLKLVAYNLKDGTEVWTVSGLPYQVSPSPIVFDNTIFMAAWDAGGVGADFDTYLSEYDKNQSGTIEFKEHNFRWDFPKYDRNKDWKVTRQEFDELVGVFNASRNALMAVQPGGSGNVTETHVKWQATNSIPHVPTVLAYRGMIYTVRNGGILSCYDAKSGERYYRVRLPDTANYYSSPVAANGHVYIASEKGVVSVVGAGREFQLVATNRFGADIMATPAILENTLYVRAGGTLYAFEE